MTENLLEARGVYTHHGKVPKLLDVSFALPKGEITCILGSNGAGKTTILETILGMIKPDQGEILFEGKPITGLASHKIVASGIGMAAASAGTFPKMTVEQNLLFGGYHMQDKKAIQKQVAMVYEVFPVLRERRNQKAGTLSGGERTMLTIGRAIISSPKILLLDEPSLGLAPIMVQETFAMIEHLNKSSGMTILLVEQNAERALALCKTGYILDNGQIVMGGDEKALRASAYLQHPIS